MRQAPAARPRSASRFRHRILLPAVLLLLPVALTGCGTEDAPPPAVTITDSAGVTVVEHGSGVEESVPRWLVATEPELVVGAEGSGATLTWVVGLAARPDGGVVVADRTQEILVFSGDGALVRRLGGEGDGPGEFRRLSEVHLLGGDSLAGYEGGEARLTVFGPDGEAAREVDFGGLMEGRPSSRLLPLDTGGFALLAMSFLNSDSSGVHRDSKEAFRVGADGRMMASYGRFPGLDVFYDPDAGVMGRLAFGAALHGVAARHHLVVGTADSPEIRYYAPSGSLERIVRWPDWNREVTEADFDAYLEEQIVANAPEARRAAVRNQFGDLPFAEEAPPYDNLVASSGHVWVGRYRGMRVDIPNAGPPPAQQWWIFGPDGVMVATAETPEGFILHEATEDRLLGVHKDALEVQTVRAYRYTKTGG